MTAMHGPTCRMGGPEPLLLLVAGGAPLLGAGLLVQGLSWTVMHHELGFLFRAWAPHTNNLILTLALTLTLTLSCSTSGCSIYPEQEMGQENQWRGFEGSDKDVQTMQWGAVLCSVHEMW